MIMCMSTLSVDGRALRVVHVGAKLAGIVAVGKVGVEAFLGFEVMSEVEDEVARVAVEHC